MTKKYEEQSQHEKATEAVKHLQDDNNDGHKLYAIAECLLSIASSLNRLVELKEPEVHTCFYCGGKFTSSFGYDQMTNQAYHFECKNKASRES